MRTWEVTYLALITRHEIGNEVTRLIEAPNALDAEREAQLQLRSMWTDAPPDLELRWLSTREVVKPDEILQRWADLSLAPTSTRAPWEYTGRGSSWEESAEVLGPSERDRGTVSRVVVAACSTDDDARMIAIDRNARDALVATVFAYDRLLRRLNTVPNEYHPGSPGSVMGHLCDTIDDGALETLKSILKRELNLCVDG